MNKCERIKTSPKKYLFTPSNMWSHEFMYVGLYLKTLASDDYVHATDFHGA